jgi:hypothetical protein
MRRFMTLTLKAQGEEVSQRRTVPTFVAGMAINVQSSSQTEPQGPPVDNEVGIEKRTMQIFQSCSTLFGPLEKICTRAPHTN